MGVKNREKRGALAFLSKTIYLFPAVILMAVFFAGPVVLTVYYSFTNLALTGAAAQNFRFVGFDNYIRLFQDTALFSSVQKTLVFLIGSIIGQTITGFFIALFMREKSRTFRRVIGAFVIGGWVMPEMVASICLTSVFSKTGSLNLLLSLFGEFDTNWLYAAPMLTMIISNVWRGTAFSMMVYQSALDNVPGDIVESASLDGATGFQRMIYIILPCIKNTIMTNTMMITLMTLGVFGMIYSMTGGGPGNLTTTLPIFMYLRAFKNYDMGYGTAISMILLAIGVFFGVLYTRFASRTEVV